MLEKAFTSGVFNHTGHIITAVLISTENENLYKRGAKLGTSPQLYTRNDFSVSKEAFILEMVFQKLKWHNWG